jgi:hypothetical protein
MPEKIYIQVNDKRIEATGERLDYILKIRADAAAAEKAAADEAAAKDKAKASALAKLEALGLTADEAQAIAGF